MDNLVLAPPSPEIEEFSRKLGFTRTLFADKDFIVVETKSKKELLDAVNKAKGKPIFYRAADEETLRFVLEKTPIKFVFGMEGLAAKDSLHQVRGGLDQVLCKIAAEKRKLIAFSCSDLLNAPRLGQTMARMKFNIRLCQKYHVKMFFSTFAQEKMELRSAHDVAALWRVLGGNGKGELSISL